MQQDKVPMALVIPNGMPTLQSPWDETTVTPRLLGSATLYESASLDNGGLLRVRARLLVPTRLLPRFGIVSTTRTIITRIGRAKSFKTSDFKTFNL